MKYKTSLVCNGTLTLCALFPEHDLNVDKKKSDNVLSLTVAQYAQLNYAVHQSAVQLQ